MVNVSAQTIHVGPRYEALSPTEKIEALVTADGYRELVATEAPPPPPAEKEKMGAGIVFIAVGLLFFYSGLDFAEVGFPIFSVVGLLIVAFGVYAIVKTRATVRDYYSKPAEIIPVYVRSKDYVSRATDVDRTAGIFMVSFVTSSGQVRTAELASDHIGLVAPGEVGVATLRLGRLIDFRHLQVMQGPPRG